MALNVKFLSNKQLQKKPYNYIFNFCHSYNYLKLSQDGDLNEMLRDEPSKELFYNELNIIISQHLV